MTYVLKTVRLHGVSPALDGAKAQVRYEESSATALAEVTWLNGAFISDGSLFVSLNRVEDALPDIAEDDLDGRNPFGSFITGDRWSDGKHELSWAVYDLALTVNITHLGTRKSHYNEVFYGKHRDRALEELKRMETTPGVEPWDFAFVGARIKQHGA